MPSGPIAAVCAYILWGPFPLYARQIADIPALEDLLHRSARALVFMLGRAAAST